MHFYLDPELTLYIIPDPKPTLCFDPDTEPTLHFDQDPDLALDLHEFDLAFLMNSLFKFTSHQLKKKNI